MQVVFGTILQSGALAKAADVMARDQTIATVVNGNLEDDNIKTGADIDAAKLLNSSIIEAKYGLDSVPGNAFANDTAGATAGRGANRSELFTQSIGTTLPTNVNADRNQHGGKTIWVYGSWVNATSFPLMIDDSIDWRQRIVFVTGSVQTEGPGAQSGSIPGGSFDHLHSRALHIDGTINNDMNLGMFYTSDGTSTATPQSLPTLEIEFDSAATVSLIRIFADIISGDLYMDATVPISTSVEMLLKIDCSPECV